MTLNEEKTIDVGKIIKNETRLKEENERLLETVRKQDSTIQALADRNISYLERLERKNEAIEDLSQSIHDLAEKQLEMEEKRNTAARFFIKPEINYFPGTKRAAAGAGILYTFKKWGVGTGLGTFDSELYIKGEVAISLF